jgi:hypothetical protein
MIAEDERKGGDPLATDQTDLDRPVINPPPWSPLTEEAIPLSGK